MSPGVARRSSPTPSIVVKRAVDEFEHHDWFGVERLAGGAGLKADAGERLPGGDGVGEAGDVVSGYASVLVDPARVRAPSIAP